MSPASVSRVFRPPASTRRMHDRHGGDQRLGVGAQRVGIERPLVGCLHDVAQMHHRDPHRDVLHHAEVVGKQMAAAVGIGFTARPLVQLPATLSPWAAS
jgi:hypothetical protein